MRTISIHAVAVRRLYLSQRTLYGEFGLCNQYHRESRLDTDIPHDIRSYEVA